MTRLREIPLTPNPSPAWSCEKIQNSLKTRREGTPPPLIRRELQPLLEPGALTGRIFSQPEGSFKEIESSDSGELRSLDRQPKTRVERALLRTLLGGKTRCSIFSQLRVGERGAEFFDELQLFHSSR